MFHLKNFIDITTFLLHILKSDIFYRFKLKENCTKKSVFYISIKNKNKIKTLIRLFKQINSHLRNRKY